MAFNDMVKRVRDRNHGVAKYCRSKEEFPAFWFLKANPPFKDYELVCIDDDMHRRRWTGTIETTEDTKVEKVEVKLIMIENPNDAWHNPEYKLVLNMYVGDRIYKDYANGFASDTERFTYEELGRIIGRMLEEMDEKHGY